jgi:hypothetical protein
MECDISDAWIIIVSKNITVIFKITGMERDTFSAVRSLFTAAMDFISIIITLLLLSCTIEGSSSAYNNPGKLKFIKFKSRF